ncbi:sigma-70 family RNA polymerase sigma factor (plasmid) [Alicyclobacillus sp. TC]|uniref:RNA polymerase sigma factor (Sigma-70 family) n=2 Tax=Alicyclobacillus TaxID=29330 RepID=A0ABT9M062_9BACL|nr:MULTISPECIES: sigma-70 family RNA polymerase sigma factor [Alicyclobacillus]MDP9729924.1 RNA polymerase sigma factor (sigma-70 family) [Alicyclobacillus tengchongensis]QRF24917.1 sigma-70 family RNA polymerase sigma factor [Alicyclobacillus sp. TC]
MHTFETLEDIKRFVIAVAKAKSVDYWRRESRYRNHEQLTLNQANEQGEEPIETLPSTDAERDFQEVEMRLVLDTLPEKQKRVMVGLVLEDKTERELAEELKLSQSTVHRLKTKAIQQLQKFF